MLDRLVPGPLPYYRDREVGAIVQIEAEPIPTDAPSGKVTPLVVHGGYNYGSK